MRRWLTEKDIDMIIWINFGERFKLKHKRYVETTKV